MRHVDEEHIRVAFFMQIAILALAVPVFVVAEFVDSVDMLYEAAKGGNTVKVERLIAEGVDVNAQNPAGRYALDGAAIGNYQDTLRRLLALGADPSSRNARGETPLICATKYGGGKAATIRLLMKSGADPGAIDDDGRTALDYAVQNGQGAAIRVLDQGR